MEEVKVASADGGSRGLDNDVVRVDDRRNASLRERTSFGRTRPSLHGAFASLYSVAVAVGSVPLMFAVSGVVRVA